MPAPGSLDLTAQIALTKQALGGRTGGLLTDAWYTARVNSGYARVTTFQGLVLAPGMRRPRFRALRFFELYSDDDATISTGLTHNFITPAATAAQVVYVDNVYDLTNNRPVRRKALRYLHSLNPDNLGTPRCWAPGGRDSVGYYINPVPGVAGDIITVREHTYQYPVTLSVGTNVPVIPAPWHRAIWLAAAAEGADLLDWPEKAAEMEQKFMMFIANKRSPVEESGAAGGRRHFTVGGA